MLTSRLGLVWNPASTTAVSPGLGLPRDSRSGRRTHRIRSAAPVTVLKRRGPVRVFRVRDTRICCPGSRGNGRPERLVHRRVSPIRSLAAGLTKRSFEDKLDLLYEAPRQREMSTGPGDSGGLTGQGVYRDRADPCPYGWALAGRPVIRPAGALGLPLMVAIIGGERGASGL